MQIYRRNADLGEGDLIVRAYGIMSLGVAAVFLGCYFGITLSPQISKWQLADFGLLVVAGIGLVGYGARLNPHRHLEKKK